MGQVKQRATHSLLFLWDLRRLGQGSRLRLRLSLGLVMADGPWSAGHTPSIEVDQSPVDRAVTSDAVQVEIDQLLKKDQHKPMGHNARSVTSAYCLFLILPSRTPLALSTFPQPPLVLRLGLGGEVDIITTVGPLGLWLDRVGLEVQTIGNVLDIRTGRSQGSSSMLGIRSHHHALYPSQHTAGM